ncbi:hypothetical protein [Oceanobacillus sojae]|uniref:hypothetical protein n=1 Tax=Oceanobacillus sojae TaxID=582851 RepID=UPI00362CD02F
MGRKRVSTIYESDSGRNLKFRDNYKNKTMTNNQFVKEINSGNYPNHHVRVINGIPTPVSNPDGSKNNNLN